jgi:hypothetical protein
VVRRPLTSALLALALLGSACGGSGEGAEPSPLPSGSLGPVRPEAADQAILGLCGIAGDTERDEAATIFADRSHQTLHVIAAAVQAVDRAVAAELLEAKQVVEADLTEPVLPDGFSDHVSSLLDATRAALDAIGLPAPECPA